MYKVYNLINNPNVELVDEMGAFKVIAQRINLSGAKLDPVRAYFEAQTGIQKRQLVCNLAESGVRMEAGLMQWMAGDVELVSGVSGPFDFLKRTLRGKVTGTTTATAEYTGNGLVVTEPVYQHLILMDLEGWNGSVILADGTFYACESTVEISTVARNTVTSAAAGHAGLFNLKLDGMGCAVLKTPCPREEIIEVELENDTLKIDGSFVIAWSAGLRFTVELAASSILGSVISDEGLVNVYRGTGRIWITPNFEPQRQPAGQEATEDSRQL